MKAYFYSVSGFRFLKCTHQGLLKPYGKGKRRHAMLKLPKQFWMAIAEGTFYSVVGLLVVLLWAHYAWATTEPGGLFTADFASRWAGTCNGWVRSEAWQHLRGNLEHWWSYCTIAFVFWRLHPPLATVPYSTLTLTLVGWFIMGCGVGHLLAVLTMLHPVYRVEGWWLEINGKVSMVATVFVAFALTRAFEYVALRRAELEALRKERGL